MTLFLVVIYFLLLIGIGMLFVKYFNFPPFEKLIAAFLFGSIISGLYMFLLTANHYIKPPFLFGFLIFGFIATLINAFPIVQNIKLSATFFNQYLLQKERFFKLFIIILIILLIWIILLAYTPARSADAMRYHLAQIQDIIWHHGFIFRPYVHYHFPLYFSLMMLPIYTLSGAIGMKLAVCFYFLLSILILERIAHLVGLKHSRFLFLFLFLVPLSYHQAHIVKNDWVVIFYSLMGLLFLIRFRETSKKQFLYFAFLALGFSLGVKYQAILFVPWFCLLSLTNKNNKNHLIHFLIALFLMGCVASPFYIQNWITLKNPVFPLAGNIFGYQSDYFHLIAQYFTTTLKGHYSLSSIFIDIKSSLLYPLIPATIWLLSLPSIFLIREKKLLMGTGIISFFITWWIFQPIYYLRFSIYILPISLVAAIKWYERLLKEKRFFLIFLYRLIVVISVAYFIGIAIFYSKTYAKYYFNHNLRQYHRYTWYYNDYQYINNHTPTNATILCIVQAGQTYYLKKNYLRAEPNLSGLLNWGEIKSMKQLLRQLKSLHVNYIFYDNANWLKMLNNQQADPNLKKLLVKNSKQMQLIMLQLLRSKYIKNIFKRQEKLYTSRIKNHFMTTTVYFVKIK